MSENSLRSALERDWVTQLDDLCATLAYHQVPFKDRAEAFEKFMNRYRAALTATQEPQRGDIAVSIVTDVHHDWDESGTLSGETLRRIANFRERAAGAPAASGREWLLGGGGGHEGGVDGLRALTVTGEGLIDFLDAYREDFAAAAPRPELAPDVRPGIVAAINYCLSWYRNRHEPGFLNVALELQLRLKDGTKVFEEAYERAEREERR